MRKPTIAILGAGVSGLTTGIILNIKGYDTTIYAEHVPTWRSYERNLPAFASLYAAASVLPHAIDLEDPVEHLHRSHAFFRKLATWPDFHVRQQRHYEVFEPPERPVPPYARAMDNLTKLTSAGTLLRRHETTPVHGWSYDGFVVDMPLYIGRLLDFYRAIGGTVVEGHLSRPEFLERPEDLLINCGGLNGSALVTDNAPYTVTRGHLIYVDVPKQLEPDPPFPFSYNYMPVREVYAQPDGRAADVYFYPRPDRWVLGGSRQIIKSDDEEHSPDIRYPSTIEIGGIEVPEPILSLNRHLLLRTTGVDIAKYPMQAAFGYRFERDPVRLDSSMEEGRYMVHNYGHGGAGLTISWSCAVRVLDIIRG